jgi:predicted nucleic acid-binding protein
VSRRAVVDTGPLVAIVRNREEAHAQCIATIAKLRAPLITCWPVLTEVAWLLRREPGALRVIDGLVSTGAVKIADLDAQALS